MGLILLVDRDVWAVFYCLFGSDRDIVIVFGLLLVVVCLAFFIFCVLRHFTQYPVSSIFYNILQLSQEKSFALFGYGVISVYHYS